MSGLSQTISLSDKISKRLASLEVESKNILDFAKDELGITLLPAQIFIFKLFYSIPLSSDKSENCIPIGDRFNENILYEFSETEFLDFLYKSNRINVDKIDPDNLFLNIVFVIGRRGTKTTMSSIITLHTVYLLLLLENPHEYFHILEEDEIGVAIVSNSTAGADRQFRTICKMVYSSQFFKKHLVKEPSNGYLFLKSRRLLGSKSPKVLDRGDILIATFAANPNIRGASNIATIADEFHHFLDSDVSSKKNPLDRIVFEALTPSTSGFVHPDGRPAGKNFFISSPNGRKGMLYSMYETAMNHKGEKTTSLVVNVPSHWVNHKLSSTSLRSFFMESERSFEQEYEAKFVDKTGGWLTNIKDKVYNAITKANNNVIDVTKLNPHYTYFLGIDFGVGHDGTALAVAHYEPYKSETLYPPLQGDYVDAKDIIVIDHISYLLPEAGQLVTLEAIYNELQRIHSYFPIQEGGFDQWSAGIFEQLLQERGYNHLRKLTSTQQSNSDQAKLFRQLICENRLILPNKPDFTEELFRLNETVSREGLIKVEDQDVHDDQFDAVLRAVWLAFNSVNSNEASYRVNALALHKNAQRALVNPTKANKALINTRAKLMTNMRRS